MRVLKGGINEWYATIINPLKPADNMPASDFELYATRKAASMFFGVIYPEQVKVEAPKIVKVAPKKVITIENVQANRQSNVDGNYGIGIVSKIPVQHWDRLELGNSPFGMPLVIPAENKKGKQSVRMIYVADEPRVALAATLDNGWTVINTHLSFVPFVNYRQLRKIKKWAAQLAAKHGTQALIIGDMNLPKGLPAVASKWNSLVEQNSYPSWGGKVQFDYILSDSLKPDQYEALPTLNTGVSDHLPVRVHIL